MVLPPSAFSFFTYFNYIFATLAYIFSGFCAILVTWKDFIFDMNTIFNDLKKSKLSNNKYKSQNTLKILKAALEIQQKTYWCVENYFEICCYVFMVVSLSADICFDSLLIFSGLFQ